MTNKEKKARRILAKALSTILELGYHVNVPSSGCVMPRTGQVIARADQVEFIPIPDELKRRRDEE